MKDTVIQFNFLDRIYSAEVIPSFTERPFYFFILFHEKDIIKEFGDEISIATTDGLSILNNIPIESRIRKLKETIFQAIKNVPEYSAKLFH